MDGDITRDPRWERIIARDPAADGSFWYSVATTGVFCRPSCPSRAASPRNVRFHDSIADARASGARPCLRCNPEGGTAAEQNRLLIEKACRTIEAAEEQPDLATLAASAELSPAHFHRLFKAAVGVTPRGYAIALRQERVRRTLAEQPTITAAVHQAGFGSSSRFYEQAGSTLGMAPTRYRAGGAGERLRFAVGESSLGAVLVAASDTGIAAVLIGDGPDDVRRELEQRFPAARIEAADAAFDSQVQAVIAAIDDGAAVDLPLDIRGTAFQRRVWDALRSVPAGETLSYAALAERIGAPAATRAVAGACAANAHAVVIPCHRVVRADGSLSGYRWGVDRKRRLLAREQR